MSLHKFFKVNIVCLTWKSALEILFLPRLKHQPLLPAENTQLLQILSIFIQSTHTHTTHTHTRVYIYIYIYRERERWNKSDFISFELTLLSSSSSSSCRIACTDFPDSLSLSWSVSIFYRSQKIFETTSCVRAELLGVKYCWSSKNSTTM